MIFALLMVAISMPAQAAPPPEQVVAFNREFVKYLKGEKHELNLPGNFASKAKIDLVRADLKQKNAPTVVADGESVCRAQRGFLLCWQPVWQEGKRGLRFIGWENRAPFFPTAKDHKGFARELAAYAGEKKMETSWQDLFLPRAFAQTPVKDIRENDSRLIYATNQGWMQMDEDARGALKRIVNWSNIFLDGHEVTCGAYGAIVKLHANEGGYSVSQGSEGGFILEKAGQKYQFLLRKPESSESCSYESHKSAGSFCDDATLFAKGRVKLESKRVYRDYVKNLKMCETAWLDCSYVLPQQRVFMNKCDGTGGLCSKFAEFGPDDLETLAPQIYQQNEGSGSVSSAKAAIEKLFHEAGIPAPDFGRPDLGLKDPSQLSGSELARLEDLKNTFYSALQRFNAAKVLYSQLAVNQLLAARDATTCCKADSCKRDLVRQNGIDLIPESRRKGSKAN